MRVLISFVAVLLWQTIALGQLQITAENFAPPSVMKPVSITFTPAAVSLSPKQEAMLARSNAIVPREPSAALMDAAQDHANHLANRNFGPTNLFADPHNWAGDGTPEQRARQHGFTGSLKVYPPDAYGWSTVGEIIAPRYTADVASPFNGWLGSAGHRKSLLYSGFDRCGFGHARNRQGQSIFVALYGTENLSAPTRPATFEVAAGGAAAYRPAAFRSCGPGGCGASRIIARRAPPVRYVAPRRASTVGYAGTVSGWRGLFGWRGR